MKLGTLRSKLIQAIDSSPLNPDRPLRFSLRTLLIAITLITVGLAGLSYYLAHKPPPAPRFDQGFER